MSLNMAPLVAMATSIVNATCAEYGLSPTPRERVAMAFEFMAEWLARYNSGQKPMQEIKIHWPASPGGGS